jgi:hypothetical protein
MSAVATALYVTAGATLLTGWMGSKAAKKGQSTSNAMLQKQLDFQKDQQAKLDKQKEVYRQFKFENPYSNMENKYEDLTIDQRAAEFQTQQGAQQRANIMQGLKGAAGGSGIAGLAQSLANQGQLQAQQISAGIGQQERQNQQLALKAADSIDMAERGGEAMVQEAEMSRQSTLLGIQYGGLAGANAGVQSAYANKMSSDSAAMQMQMNNINAMNKTLQNMPWDEMDWGNPKTDGSPKTP